MSNKVRIYTGSSGLSNKVAPHRLPFDDETGVAGLEAAYNVVIDKTGQVVTRRGMINGQSGSFHSLYPFNDNSFLCVKEGNGESLLMRAFVDHDLVITLEGIRSGLSPSAKMTFCEVAGRYYYMNGAQLGSTDGETSLDWPHSVYPRETEAVHVPTFAGNHLDMISGTFVYAKNDELFWTEDKHWGIVRLGAANRRFKSRILLNACVQTGTYVSDEQGVYFIKGVDLYQCQVRKILNYPAVEFCRMPGLIDPSEFGLETNQLSVMFGTVRGPVIGLPDGTAVNLIDKAVNMPTDCGGSQCGMMVVDESMIIMSNEV